MAKYQNKPQLSDLLKRRKQNLQQLCEDWKTYTSIDFDQRLTKEGMQATEQEVMAVDLIFNKGGKVVFPKDMVPQAVHKSTEVASPKTGEKVSIDNKELLETAKKSLDDHLKFIETDLQKYEESLEEPTKRGKKKKSSDSSDNS